MERSSHIVLPAGRLSMYIRSGLTMDALIQDLDDSTFRAIRARAALEGRSIGEVATEALRAYLTRTGAAEDRVVSEAGNSSKLLDEPTQEERERVGTAVDEIVHSYCI